MSVTRASLLGHARTLTSACNYSEGEIMVCVLDFKREVGLWHAVVASVFNGMHVIFIPYALMKVRKLRPWWTGRVPMGDHSVDPEDDAFKLPLFFFKVNPASWMQMVTKHRATVAVCKSRDLHWGLLATKDHRELNLSSLRLLVVADGANPWSLSSCDQFLSVFQVNSVAWLLTRETILTVSFFST